MHFFEELRRRNVTRAAAAYGAAAWLLVQVGDATLEAFGLGTGAQRVLIIALAVGFLPAMALAWAFEITPEGIRREEDPALDAPLRARTNRALDRLIIALMALALGYFAIDKFLLAPQREATRVTAATDAARREAARTPRGARTIAVLAFQNMSSDPEQAYFSDGIAEEVLNLLAKIPELSVTSRTSAFAFKDKTTSVVDIARALDVAYLLEGSVRRSGNRVRITTQLIDASNDAHLWSETYDRTLEDVFAVQDDVAGKVVAQLQLKLLGAAPHARPVDSAAYTHFLRARQLLGTWVVADAAAAIEQLQKVIAIAPDYAPAYALQAEAVMIEGAGRGTDQAALQATVAPLIAKALALDASLGEAYVTRAQLQRADPAAAEADIRRGLALAPSYARGYEILANHLDRQPGREDEVLTAIDRARALDPLAARNHYMKAIFLENRNDFVGTEALLRQAITVEPRFRGAYARLGAHLAVHGRFADAVATGEQAFALDPDAPWLRQALQLNYLDLGDMVHILGAPTPGSVGLLVRVAEGKGHEAGELLYAMDPARHAEVPLTKILMAHAAETGEYARARDLARSALHYDGTLDKNTDIFGLIAHAELAWLMRQSGDAEGARFLLEAVRSQLDRIGRERKGFWFLVNACHALVRVQAGDTAGAIAELEQAWQPPVHRWWVFALNYAPFAPLQDEPRYQALMARVHAHVTGERAKLEAMRQRGEIPRRATDGPSAAAPPVAAPR